MGIAGSLFMIAVGAILAFAINISDTTVGAVTINWDLIGFILMAAGAIGLIWALFLTAREEDRADRTVERRRTDDRI